MTLKVNPKFISQDMTTDSELADGLSLKQDKSEKNQPSGYAGLDATGKVLSSQLPEIFETSQVIDGGQPSSLYVTENIDGGNP
jgi:hypothetical protein